MNIPLITIYDSQGNEIQVPALKGKQGNKGDRGYSAYQLAVANGFEGTEAQWLASLKGSTGDSAYEIAVGNGFEGTESEWLASLKGATGDSTTMKAIAPENDDAPPSAAAVYEALQNVTFDTEDFVEITQDNKIRTTIGDETNNSKSMIFNDLLVGQTISGANSITATHGELSCDAPFAHLKEQIGLKVGNYEYDPVTVLASYPENMTSNVSCTGQVSDISQIPAYLTITGTSVFYNYNLTKDNTIFSMPTGKGFHITFSDGENDFFTPVTFTTEQLTTMGNFADTFNGFWYSYNCANASTFITNYAIVLTAMYDTSGENTYSADLTMTPDDSSKSCFICWAQSAANQSSNLSCLLISTLTNKSDYIVQDGESSQASTTVTMGTSRDMVPVVGYNIQENPAQIIENYSLMNIALFNFPYTKVTNSKPTIALMFDDEDYVLFLADDDVNNKHLEIYGIGTGYKVLPDTALRESEYVKINDGQIKLKLGEQRATKTKLFETQLIPKQDYPSSLNFSSDSTDLIGYKSINSQYEPEVGNKMLIKLQSIPSMPFGEEAEIIWSEETLTVSGSSQNIPIAAYNCSNSAAMSWFSSAYAALMNSQTISSPLPRTDSTKPSFAILLTDSSSSSTSFIILTSQDLTNTSTYNLEVYKYSYETIKLPSSYVDINIETTDTIEEDGTEIPTSGAVWTAMQSAGKVKTVNNQEPDSSGNIDLSAYLSGAMHFRGISTSSNLYQGSVSITGITTTNGTTVSNIQAGDVLINRTSGIEFVYDGAYWQKLGDDSTWVPKTRTVNRKALSSNISLTASDVGALSSSTTISTLGGVPTSRTINNIPLTSDITLNWSNIGTLDNTIIDTTNNIDNSNSTNPVTTKAVYDYIQYFIDEVIGGEY